MLALVAFAPFSSGGGVRGAWLRALAFALLILGSAIPTLVQENRSPLKDIVAMVVDRSESQDIGERPRQTDEARDALKAKLARSATSRCRIVETSREESDTEGTQLFSALRGALADAPPERVGGAILVTDGDVHDIPESRRGARLQRAACMSLDHRA